MIVLVIKNQKIIDKLGIYYFNVSRERVMLLGKITTFDAEHLLNLLFGQQLICRKL